MVVQYSVRMHTSVVDGSRHAFQNFYWFRYLPRKYQALCQFSIQTNANFAIPENVLLAMITEVENRHYSIGYHATAGLRSEWLHRFDFMGKPWCVCYCIASCKECITWRVHWQIFSSVRHQRPKYNCTKFCSSRYNHPLCASCNETERITNRQTLTFVEK